METKTRTEADSIIETIRALHKPEIMELSDSVDVLVTPNGMTVQSIKKLLDEYLTAPERRKGTATLKDLASFIEHANRFKDEDSVIFADPDPKQPKLVSLLDYHEKGANGKPRFGEHRGTYEFPVSDEWTVWNDNDEVPMEQAKFAEFIEANLVDIHDPTDTGDIVRELMLKLDCTLASPAKLLELSRNLQVNVGMRVVNAVNTQSGEAIMNFATEHTDKDGAQLRLPGAFLLLIPVFRSGDSYRMAARLRYRIDHGKAYWFYKLYRAQETFDHAFEQACLKASADTEIPLYVGTPER